MNLGRHLQHVAIVAEGRALEAEADGRLDDAARWRRAADRERLRLDEWLSKGVFFPSLPPEGRL